MPPAAQSQHYTPDGLASAEPPGPAGHTAGKTHYQSQREIERERGRGTERGMGKTRCKQRGRGKSEKS